MNENNRLKAIKERYVFIKKECCCCRENIKNEKMFALNRYANNRIVYRVWYCKNCTPTKNDVLNEVDTDSSPYGIAYVDEYKIAKKK